MHLRHERRARKRAAVRNGYMPERDIMQSRIDSRKLKNEYNNVLALKIYPQPFETNYYEKDLVDEVNRFCH